MLAGPSSLELAEYFVPLKPRFDAVLLCGPFVHQSISTEEHRITTEGYIVVSLYCILVYLFLYIIMHIVYAPSADRTQLIYYLVFQHMCMH